MSISLHLVYDYRRFSNGQHNAGDVVVLLEDAVTKCYQYSSAYAIDEHLAHRGISHDRAINYAQLLELINTHERLIHWI